MLKNFLKIAYRTLLKSKAFSFINIFGLAIGIAAFLFIIQYVRYERSYENFHKNADNIYRITYDLYNGSEFVVTDCETQPGIGPLLKEKMPEVIDYVRLFQYDGLIEVKVGENKFLESKIYLADPSVYTVFSLTTLIGDSQNPLDKPMQTVLTKTMATKYFGRMDVVGESVEVDGLLYLITAVIADIPANTHLKFDILLSHASMKRVQGWYDETSWNGNNEYTYLVMDKNADLAIFNSKLQEISLSLKDKIGDDKFGAEYLKDIHLYSTKSFEPEPPGSARNVSFLLIIAFFVLAIAWVNYVNLATARATDRAREVGIRKVMGSAKAQLMLQFISESIIINLLAGALALTLFYLLLPSFVIMTGLPLMLISVVDQTFISIFILILLVGSLLSGIYPALVLSSFQPATVLKGKFRSSAHGQRLRKSLVVFQFSATVVLLVCMIIVQQQINFLRTIDLGMNLDQTLVVSSPKLSVSDSTYNSIFSSFKTELLGHSEIQKISVSESLPGLSLNELSSTTNIQRVGRKVDAGNYSYYFFAIDADFIPTMNMNIIAGRNFENQSQNLDQTIINEEAALRLGYSNPEEAIGTKITFRTRWDADEPSTVIGVIKNFYQRSPKEDHIPMLFRYSDQGSYFSIRFAASNASQTLDEVKNVWKKAFPNSAFQYFFLDENFEKQYKADDRFGKVVSIFSGLITVIACLGLFGLSSYTLVQRTKEIGIRKVMGASVNQIVALLTKDFAIVILIAAILALPISYFAMNQWLTAFATKIQLSVWMFALPVLIILFVGLITVSIQTINAAMSNPTHSLRQE
jgi:putative ABC transport system permease protein